MSAEEMRIYLPCESGSNHGRISPQNFEKKCRKKRKCLWMMIGCSVVFNLLTLSFVFYLWLQLTSIKHSALSMVEQETTNATIRDPKSEYLSHNLQTSGTFPLNQNILEANKTIRWVSDEGSSIIPDTTSPCLTIPVSGRYLIISRFTFKIPKTEPTTETLHFFKIKLSSGEMKDHSYKRSIVSLAESKLMNGADDLKKANVFIEFYNIEAGEKICVNTSLPELLFISSLDNDVNILKF